MGAAPKQCSGVMGLSPSDIWQTGLEKSIQGPEEAALFSQRWSGSTRAIPEVLENLQGQFRWSLKVSRDTSCHAQELHDTRDQTWNRHILELTMALSLVPLFPSLKSKNNCYSTHKEGLRFQYLFMVPVTQVFECS